MTDGKSRDTTAPEPEKASVRNRAGAVEAPARDQTESPARKDGDSMASKLSQELTNWRQRRTDSRDTTARTPTGKFKSGPARTIKVRGHETLVVRKPRLPGKRSPEQPPAEE